jgi:hypothetical protein
MVLFSARIHPKVKEFYIGISFSYIVVPRTLLLSSSLKDGKAHDPSL